MGEIASRRANTATRIEAICAHLGPASKIAAGKASVYATGSFGRGEASQYSDLDLFIIGKRGGQPGPNGVEGSQLSRLDEIRIKADLIETTRDLQIPDFDGDGRYLVHYSVHELTKSLGTPHDDVTNTFTARLLLLLESHPLVEPEVYNEVIEEVVAAYWRDYEDHKSAFLPAFLANDILRLWRTFCVNYEARTERKPDEKKAKGKVKNYKLKHSRLLTCFSALLYLLAIYKRAKTVAPTDALSMIKLSPTQRLEWLLDQSEFAGAAAKIKELLERYEGFLAATNLSEAELIERFSDPSKSKVYMDDSYKLGDAIFDALKRVGDGDRFYRLIVV